MSHDIRALQPNGNCNSKLYPLDLNCRPISLASELVQAWRRQTEACYLRDPVPVSIMQYSPVLIGLIVVYSTHMCLI